VLQLFLLLQPVKSKKEIHVYFFLDMCTFSIRGCGGMPSVIDRVSEIDIVA